MRVWGAWVLGWAVLCLISSAEAAATRIGFVDVQKVIVKSVSGVAAREQLEREKATMQKEIDARTAEIEKLREELEKKGLVLNPDVKREKEEFFQRRMRERQRLADDYKRDLERKEQGLTQRILQDLTGLIERVGKERGYLLILEKRGASVIYGDPEADITEDVIKAYDLEKGKEKK